MTYDIGTDGPVAFNFTNGPETISLELWSQWLNQKLVQTTNQGEGDWNEITAFYNDITEEWQQLTGTEITGIPFTRITTNDRYSEYQVSLPAFLQELATREVQGIYNYVVKEPSSGTILEEGVLKLINSDSPIQTNRYISSNESAQGFAYLQSN